MIIEVDKYKSKVEGYDPNRSEDFHKQSAMLADNDFINELKTKKYKKVVFLAGGTASGKTEYAYSYLNRFKNTVLVYDGTLKNFEGFNIKLQKIERYDKKIKNIKVVLIIPESFINSFSAFLRRERKMKIEVFFETQIKSKLTVAQILEETSFKVDIYFTRYNEDKGLQFFKHKMNRGRKHTAFLLKSLAKSIEDVAKNSNLDLKL